MNLPKWRKSQGFEERLGIGFELLIWGKDSATSALRGDGSKTNPLARSVEWDSPSRPIMPPNQRAELRSVFSCSSQSQLLHLASCPKVALPGPAAWPPYLPRPCLLHIGSLHDGASQNLSGPRSFTTKHARLVMAPRRIAFHPVLPWHALSSERWRAGHVW